MGWNIYRLENRAVIVRREDEEIEGYFEFVREATESEVEDEYARRKMSKASKASDAKHREDSPAAGSERKRSTANHPGRQDMAWNIYRLDTGAVIVREEDEEIKGGFSFIREATESEVADELGRRKTSLAQSRPRILFSLKKAMNRLVMPILRRRFR